MGYGYKIYFFIKEVLCYLVLGVILVPLRFLLGFLLGGGYSYLYRGLVRLNARLSALKCSVWGESGPALYDLPPGFTLYDCWLALKWLTVFAISAGMWMCVLGGL